MNDFTFFMKTKATSRRHFIQSMALASGALATAQVYASPSLKHAAQDQLMTVTGPISAEQLGICLHHEHIVSRFGEEPEALPTYDYDAALADIVPYLQYMRRLGCSSIFCCTTKYFGRDVKLLKRVAEASGMQIIANTGFYGAANDRYVPEFAFSSPAKDIAKIWTDEFTNGIDDSGIKPGFMKVGIDGGVLSEIDAKLVEAGAICHRETGLALQVHTGDNLPAVKQQLEILDKHGVSPTAWIWIHAQNVKNPDDLLYAAEKGAWISLDALRTVNYYEQREKVKITVERHLELLNFLKERGFIKQVLLAHDGSSYPQAGKSKRSFEPLFTTFIPMMKSIGYTQEEIDQLIIKNPTHAFAIRKRLV